MAPGTVVFQTNITSTPPAGLPVMADSVNDSDHGAGTAQYIKIMDGRTAGTIKAAVTSNGVEVDVTRVQGTVQALGTFQPLAGSVHIANSLVVTIGTISGGTVQTFGTNQVLGSVQTVGTSQVLGSVQGVGTFQVLGSVQGVGTFQVLGSVQTVGTSQVLGSVQTVGTSQALGTFQPLAGSVHLASGTVPNTCAVPRIWNVPTP